MDAARRDDDVISEGGFTDCSELMGADGKYATANENGMDVVIGQGSIDLKTITQAYFPGLPASTSACENILLTTVLIDFYDFDTVCTRTTGGLLPKYDSIITCAPFNVDGKMVEAFNTGVIRFSLQVDFLYPFSFLYKYGDTMRSI